MRIAVVTTSYPSHDDDGAGSFVRAEAIALREAGEVHVICPGPGVVDAGIDVHPVGGAPAFGWPGAPSKIAGAPWLMLSAGRFVIAARRALRRLGPQRVQAHWLFPSAFPISDGLDGLEAVAHGGDVRLWLRSPPAVRDALMGAILRRDARLRFVSSRARSDVLARAGRMAAELEARSYVAPCALLPFGRRAPRARVRSSLGIDAARPLACVTARLVAGKRVDHALSAIVAAGLDAVVVGDGPERPRLEARYPACFVGQVGRSRALDILAASDLLVDASRAEGAPTAIREARALGVPVVSCGAGDVPLWARDDAGITVVGDFDLAAAISAAR